MFYSNRNRYTLLSPDDDGTGGGAGGDSGTGGDPKADEAKVLQLQQIELLTQSVGTLAKGLEELRTNQSSITEALAKLAEGTGQSKQDQTKIAQELFGDDVDLEHLDRKSFAKLIQASITQAVTKDLNTAQEKISGQINELASRFESKNANEQITATAEKNPDFWEWSTEIKKVLTEHPNLSVIRAYNLVKAENPDKVAKMNEKYNKPAAKKETPFVGLTPTSSNRTDGTAKKMSASEAANAAFESVIARVGGDVFNKEKSII
jgi:hypothetical protein